MPTPSPRSRNSTRKSRTPSPQPKSKRAYTRRTGRERIGQRIGKIEKAVGEIKSLVDSHCGDAALKTVRAAAVAAAEEVLEATGVTPTPAAAGEFPRGVYGTNASGFRQLAPGNNNLRGEFNTPPLLETLRPATIGVTKSRKIKKAAAQAAADFEAVANGTAAPAAAEARAKSVGPKLWNEFLRNYMANQASKGRKLTRLEAMAEAGPNYRRKHGLPEPKPKKLKTAVATANAVQVAALEQPAVAKTPRARTKKGVKILAPGSLTAKTPGRVSPLVNLAQENEEGEGGAAAAFGPTPRPLNGANARPLNGANGRLLNGANGANGANARPLNGANGRLLNGANARPLTGANGRGSPANRNGRVALSPATYGYEDEGFDENTQARKVTVGGDEYFLQENGSLFKRSGNALEEWVGYLEPGGEIKYTNGPL